MVAVSAAYSEPLCAQELQQFSIGLLLITGCYCHCFPETGSNRDLGFGGRKQRIRQLEIKSILCRPAP